MKLLPRNYLRSSIRLGVVLVMGVLLLSHDISAENGSASTMSITCNVLPTIQASFPVSLHLGDVTPNPDEDMSYVTSELQVVRVWSNTKWALKIQSDAIDGRLKEWTGEQYSSRALSFPLEWQLDKGGVFHRVTGNEAIVAEDRLPTTEQGSTVEIRFRQQISYEDVPLADSGGIYRIEVIFTAIQTY
ncbi:MAG: hypothetical protein GX338_03940 [Firmicutes bacterium]|nr:hypothetical protein [Bacillota bacterium]